jgi:hypothetical protein
MVARSGIVSNDYLMFLFSFPLLHIIKRKIFDVASHLHLQCQKKSPLHLRSVMEVQLFE